MKSPDFFKIPLTLIQIPVFLVGLSVNCLAIADNQISDAQISRIAKIAKATGTDIRIIKETTTVTVYGSHKKTNKRVKKTVISLLKQNSNSQPRWSKIINTTPSLASAPTPPHPPILEEGTDTLKAPALNARNAGDIIVY
jgi:hypothetical protein